MNPTPSTPDDDDVLSSAQPAPAPVAQVPSQAPGMTTPTQAAQPVAQPTPAPQSGSVSNPASTAQPTDPNANHPAVQRAGLLRSIFTSLAGGNPEQVSIDPQTGQTTRTPTPLSTKQIGLALAMEVLGGGLTGLAQTGPNATAKAGATAYQQGLQQQQQAQQEREQQAQTDAANQSKAIARAAAIHETNSRTLLNTSEVEQRGADSIDKLVSINRASGLLDPDSPYVDNGGQPITQQELIAGMQAGKYNSTESLGPIAGRVQVQSPDGSTRWEATHLVIKDPNTLTTVTPEQWDSYADGGLAGFKKGALQGNNVQMKLYIVQNANEQLAGRYLANQRLSDLRNTLDGTQFADKVPASVDYSKPGVANAMTRFQKYVSHDSTNLSDPYSALQQMGADKRNPQTGEMQPNPDAKFVDTVAGAFGGWPVLQAAHNQMDANKKAAADFAVIDTDAKATAVLAAPQRFTPDQQTASKNFLQLSQQQGERKTADEARQRAVATGADVEAMYKFGINPVTKEKLTLDNAPDSLLVTPSGVPVPQNQQALWKPSAQEKQTGDTARRVIELANNLRQTVQQNPNLAGPISGRSKQALAKLGVGDEQAQQYLDNVSFLQTAATKMHTSRFSNQILDKMSSLISPNMNPSQFNGALNSILSIAQQYAGEDALTTVADYKTRQAQTSAIAAQASAAAAGVPTGGIAARDTTGKVVGYKLPSGQYVPLGSK